MNISWRKLAPCTLWIALAGCSSSQNQPLLFLQATTVGISASTTGSTETPELALGYRDIDVALVPVTDEAGHPIRAKYPDATGAKFSDALSVFGQFQVNANAGTTTSAGLGKFFATGLAAQQIAAGFQKWLGQTPAANASGK